MVIRLFLVCIALSVGSIASSSTSTETARFAVETSWVANKYSSLKPESRFGYFGMNLDSKRFQSMCRDYELTNAPEFGKDSYVAKVSYASGVGSSWDFGGRNAQTDLTIKKRSNSGIVWIFASMKFNGVTTASNFVFDTKGETTYVPNSLQILEGPSVDGKLYDPNERTQGYDMVQFHPVLVISPCK